MEGIMNMRYLILCFAAVLGMLLGGCATQKIPEFHAQYYPNCYDPIDRLCKDKDHSDEIKQAAVGAALGAAGGALLGGILSGNAKGALYGAAGGAVAGGLAGFFKARLEKIQDRERRLAEYQNILGEASRNWDLEQASVERAFKCYGEQIRLLKNLVARKQIARAEFLARMNEIKAGLDNINTYWAGAQRRMDVKLADGEAFLQQQDAEDQRKLAAAQQMRARQQVAEQRRRTAQKRRAVTQTITQTNRARDLAMDDWNSLMKYSENSSQLGFDEHGYLEIALAW